MSLKFKEHVVWFIIFYLSHLLHGFQLELPLLLGHLRNKESRNEKSNDRNGQEDGHPDPPDGIRHAVVHADVRGIKISSPITQKFIGEERAQY
jgi:hypothetical protein